MSLESALAKGRAAAEALMTDTVRFTAPGAGERVRNSATGTYVEPDAVVVYEGKCRVQQPALGDPETPERAGREVSLTGVTILIPISAAVPDAGARAEILSSAHDPALVGQALTVEAVQRKSHATARRILCERGD